MMTIGRQESVIRFEEEQKPSCFVVLRGGRVFYTGRKFLEEHWEDGS
jgi:hypothetical protein